MYILILIFGVVFLSGCFGPGINDWDFSLPNNYSIWHINSNQIELVLEDSSNDASATPVLEDKFVVGFLYNENYVGVKAVNQSYIDSKKSDGLKIKDIVKEEILEYYILDTFTGKIYGPYNVKQFDAELDKLGATNMSVWYNTDQNPSYQRK